MTFSMSFTNSFNLDHAKTLLCSESEDGGDEKLLIKNIPFFQAEYPGMDSLLEMDEQWLMLLFVIIFFLILSVKVCCVRYLIDNFYQTILTTLRKFAIARSLGKC